jgi:hypothetical protein
LDNSSIDRIFPVVTEENVRATRYKGGKKRKICMEALTIPRVDLSVYFHTAVLGDHFLWDRHPFMDWYALFDNGIVFHADLFISMIMLSDA